MGDRNISNLCNNFNIDGQIFTNIYHKNKLEPKNLGCTIEYTVYFWRKHYIYMESHNITCHLKILCVEDDITEVITIFVNVSLNSFSEVGVNSVYKI